MYCQSHTSQKITSYFTELSKWQRCWGSRRNSQAESLVEFPCTITAHVDLVSVGNLDWSHVFFTGNHGRTRAWPSARTSHGMWALKIVVLFHICLAIGPVTFWFHMLFLVLLQTFELFIHCQLLVLLCAIETNVHVFDNNPIWFWSQMSYSCQNLPLLLKEFSAFMLSCPPFFICEHNSSSKTSSLIP